MKQKQQNLAAKEAGKQKATALPHTQFLDTESPQLTVSGHRQAQNGSWLMPALNNCNKLL